jgi:hypothetical protein
MQHNNELILQIDRDAIIWKNTLGERRPFNIISYTFLLLRKYINTWKEAMALMTFRRLTHFLRSSYHKNG